MISSTHFELHGQFAGFFRDFFGRRRMVLKVAGEELYLKVPKPLRQELDGRLRTGQSVVVTGNEEADSKCGLGRDRRVVTTVQVEGEVACVTCPIRVCAKKNCWRDGGKELYRELERQIDEAGLGDRVKLKAVDCLDHCKRGPNAEVAGHDFHRCTVGDAERILASLVGTIARRDGSTPEPAKMGATSH